MEYPPMYHMVWFYTFSDFIITLRRVVKYFGWQNFSIIGHSFGSAMAHIYSSMHPLEVDKFVSLDCARSVMSMRGSWSNGLDGLPLLRRITEKTLKAERNISKDLPSYSREEIAKAYCAASNNYSVSLETVESLLVRGVNNHPNQKNRFFFTRDPKLRYSEFHRPNSELLEVSARNIKCQVLPIVGQNGFTNVMGEKTDADHMFFHLEKLVEQSAASYQRIIIDGTHHFHLNTPEKISPFINKFLS